MSQLGGFPPLTYAGNLRFTHDFLSILWELGLLKRDFP